MMVTVNDRYTLIVTAAVGSVAAILLGYARRCRSSQQNSTRPKPTLVLCNNSAAPAELRASYYIDLEAADARGYAHTQALPFPRRYMSANAGTCTYRACMNSYAGARMHDAHASCG